MVTLLIALGALLVAVVGCALLSSGREHDHSLRTEHDHLMEDVAQPFF